MAKRIIIFHMLNDYSGSPIILSNVIRGLVEKGFEIDLFTSLKSDGPLSDIKGIRLHHIFYELRQNRIITSVLFMLAQVKYFFAVLRFRKIDGCVIYLNTILPFGAALGGYVSRQKIMYHVHEKPVKPSLLYGLAWTIFRNLSDSTILVSEYLSEGLVLKRSPKYVVHNALSPLFAREAGNCVKNPGNRLNILMVSSLRKNKGLFLFAELAGMLPDNSFTLVVSAKNRDIGKFFRGMVIPDNMSFVPASGDIHEFYCKADLVLNLSLPDMIIETFGLTILEGMSYGIPAIVPPFGGVLELIEDGVEGYRIDPYELEKIRNAIIGLDTDRSLYFHMSENARRKSTMFNYDQQINKIGAIISDI
jgi:L-malate glycosyltransferase